MSGRQYSNQRKAGREHWPLYPKGFIAIRIVQLVLSVCVLGLAGFSVALLSFDGLHLILFVAVATLITTIYHIVAHFGAPHSYNYWAVLSLDIFLLIFWLISFALLATEISLLSDYYYYCNGGYDLCTVSETYSACVAAAAGVGGLEFALFIVSLVIHSIMVHRHRKAGLHCNPVHSPGGHQQPAIPLTTNAEKTGAQAHSQAYQQQQQPQQAAAPSYVQQQQPQATYAPSPTPPTAAGYSSPTQQQHYSQQQQQVPQQQAPSPLSLQPTGNSIQHQQYSQYSTQNAGPPYEAPVQHPNNGPYEAQGH